MSRSLHHARTLSWTGLFLVLSFLSFSLAGDDNLVVYDHCIQGSIHQYCAHIEASPDNCMMLNGTFSSDDRMYWANTDVTTITGADGFAEMACLEQSGNCESCWSVDRVQWRGDQLQTCYTLVVICHGVFTVRETFDAGCTNTTGCVQDQGDSSLCPDGCSDHGTCLENGWCECDDGYFGDSCSAYIDMDTGCFSDEKSDVSFCVQEGETSQCGQVVIQVTQGEEEDDWTVYTDSVLDVSQAAQYQLNLQGGCMATLELYETSQTAEGFATCVRVAADCVGDIAFPLYCFSAPVQDCAGHRSCYYSTDDTSIMAQSGQAFTMASDEWVYYTLRKQLNQPLADVSLSVTVTEGQVDFYEQTQCRPTLDQYRSTTTMAATGSPVVWSVIDDCNQAVQAGMQRTNLLFFGMHCQNPSGCALSFDFTAHTVQTISEGDIVNRALWERPGYQYFQIFPTYDNIIIQMQLTYPEHNQVSGAVYVQKNECASSDVGGSFASVTETSSIATLHGLNTATYRLTLDPVAENLIGQPLEITAVTSSSCEGEVQCGYLTLAVFYEERSSDGLPSASEPVTGTHPQTDTADQSSVPVETFSETAGSDGSSLVDISTGADDDSTEPAVSDSDNDGGDDDDDGDEGTSLILIIVASLFAVFGVIGGLFLLAVSVVYLRRKLGSGKRHELSFDDDGLLLGDEEFDL